jgi:hypothetical protein
MKERIGKSPAWAWCRDHKQQIGDTTFYRCTSSLSRGKQCSTGCKIFKPAHKSAVFELHKTNCAHDHNLRKLCVPLASRAEIDRLMGDNDRIYPAKILENLERIPGMIIPKLQDLYNYLQTIRRRKYGKGNIHLGQLASWCLDHNLVPDESMPDEPFVVDYNAFFKDDEITERRGDYERDKNGKDLDEFRFFITSRAVD